MKTCPLSVSSDVGGGPDGEGGPVAESPVRTVAVVGDGSGREMIVGRTGGCAGGIPAGALGVRAEGADKP